MKKINRREMLLFAVPAVLMAGALVAQFRPNAVKRLHSNYFPPNIFFIENIEPSTLTPYEVSRGYDTKLLVVMNYGAPRPAWWNVQNSWSSQYHAGQLSFKHGTRLTPIKNSDVYAWEPHYDKERDRYISRYYLKLATIPKSESSIVLHSKLGVGIWQKKLVSPVLPVFCEVRAPKKVVRVPLVSRQSGLTLERFLVTYLSAPESKSGSGDDMKVRIIFKREPGVAVPADADSPGGSPTLTDEKGGAVSTSVSFPGLKDAVLDWDSSIKATQPDTRYFVVHDFKFSKPQPKRLAFKSSQSFKNLWPLSFSAVIPAPAQTTANRKQSITLSVPFQVATAARKP